MNKSDQLSKLVLNARYLEYSQELGRRETWKDATEAIFAMHETQLKTKYVWSKNIAQQLKFAEGLVKKMKVLGSQRALQYKGTPILDRNERIYNCSGLYMNSIKMLQNTVWLLLAGCGVGFSVETRYINQFSKIRKPHKGKKVFIIEDSCKGWADAVGVLMSAYSDPNSNNTTFPDYAGYDVIFDFSQIRPKNALILNRFLAPGPEPLKKGLESVKQILESKQEGAALRAIDVYDIIMHCADFVRSGGVRRSATMCLFDADDEEMYTAKTGNWYETNLQRKNSNNSAVNHRVHTTKERFDAQFEHAKAFGEPGSYFVPDYGIVCNPCCEIGFYPTLPDGRTGVSFCNLCEINGAAATNAKKFFDYCRAASIIGTVQATYTDFPYLGEVTELITRKEALLGISITGWMNTPDILFDANVLKEGVKIIRETNEELAKEIGINPAARYTCTKPSGHTGLILGTGSGIHPYHADAWLRGVQIGNEEATTHILKQENPVCVQPLLSDVEKQSYAMFPAVLPKKGIKKSDITAVQFMERIKFAIENWVLPGTVPERGLHPLVTHNISNTVSVKSDEWEAVREYIWENRGIFTGIALLGDYGDVEYTQPAYQEVLFPQSLIKEYGIAAIFCSGLLVDGEHAFSQIDNALNKANALYYSIFSKYQGTEMESLTLLQNATHALDNNDEMISQCTDLQKDWLRRFFQYADRYLEGDFKKTMYCLRHISRLHTWCKLIREWKDVDWEKYIYVKPDQFAKIGDQMAIACAGGSCDITKV